MRKKNRAESIMLLYFRLYYKAIVIKTVWLRHKTRHKNQWSRIENLVINPRRYGLLVYDKRSQEHTAGKGHPVQ